MVLSARCQLGRMAYTTGYKVLVTHGHGFSIHICTLHKHTLGVVNRVNDVDDERPWVDTIKGWLGWLLQILGVGKGLWPLAIFDRRLLLGVIVFLLALNNG